MSKSSKLIHAERNKSLAEDLKNGKKYYDWVITISFYSSIHFLENLLLPITIGALNSSFIFSHNPGTFNQKEFPKATPQGIL